MKDTKEDKREGKGLTGSKIKVLSEAFLWNMS